jgi:hypothetical protein
VFGSKNGDVPFFVTQFPQTLVAANYDEETGTLGERENLVESYVRKMDWSPSGHLLAWSGLKDVVNIWDARDGIRKSIPLDDDPLALRWVNEDHLFLSFRERGAGPGENPAHSVLYDVVERRVASRLDAQVADSLGLSGARPLDEKNWLAWAPERQCLTKLRTEGLSQTDLQCFEPGTFQLMTFIPSPWGGMTLTLGRRPRVRGSEKAVRVLGLLANDGGSYEELRVDGTIITPFGPPLRWLSPELVSYGLSEGQAWKSTVLIDLTTGESTEVLTDLLEEFDPWMVAISPGAQHVAAFGTGKRIGGGTPLTIIHNVFGDR